MPPDAPEAWVDLIHPVGLSEREPLDQLSPKEPVRRRRTWRVPRFLWIVVLPTLLVGFYFGVIAANRYVSEAHFAVRRPDAIPRTAGPAVSLDETPKPTGSDDSYAVRDFLQSRDAMQLVVDRADFRGAVARAGWDWVWRFPSPFNGSKDEDLFRVYRSLVNVDYEATSGLTTLSVQAFRPEDARRIAVTLIQGAEDLVNRMNERARLDAVSVSEAEVARSKQEALQAQDRVTAFRDRESVIDPTQLSKTVLDTVGAMMLQLVEARAQLEVTTKDSPHSPQIALFRSRIRALQQQIDHERATLAGGSRSLAPRIAEYERLVLLRTFAERSYVSALNVLEAARLDMRRQQEYVVDVVAPDVADAPRYPWSISWTLGTFLAGCSMLWLFRSSKGRSRA